MHRKNIPTKLNEFIGLHRTHANEIITKQKIRFIFCHRITAIEMIFFPFDKPVFRTIFNLFTLYDVGVMFLKLFLKMNILNQMECVSNEMGKCMNETAL